MAIGCLSNGKQGYVKIQRGLRIIGIGIFELCRNVKRYKKARRMGIADVNE
jgi:hypothetical protein